MSTTGRGARRRRASRVAAPGPGASGPGKEVPASGEHRGADRGESDRERQPHERPLRRTASRYRPADAAGLHHGHRWVDSASGQSGRCLDCVHARAPVRNKGTSVGCHRCADPVFAHPGTESTPWAGTISIWFDGSSVGLLSARHPRTPVFIPSTPSPAEPAAGTPGMTPAACPREFPRQCVLVPHSPCTLVHNSCRICGQLPVRPGLSGIWVRPPKNCRSYARWQSTSLRVALAVEGTRERGREADEQPHRSQAAPDCDIPGPRSTVRPGCQGSPPVRPSPRPQDTVKPSAERARSN